MVEWLFNTAGTGELPEYKEDWCAPNDQRCWYPLPDCTYVQIYGYVRSDYGSQHGITFMLWDYASEVWVNIGSVQVPGNSNWTGFVRDFPSINTTNHLLFYTTLEGVNIEVRDSYLYSTECQLSCDEYLTQNHCEDAGCYWCNGACQTEPCGDTIADIDTTDPQHGYNPGPATPGALFGLGNPYIAVKNIGTTAGYLYIQGFQYPGQTNEIPGSISSIIVQPGSIWLKNPVINVDPNAPNPLPVGIKVWGESEAEPQW